MEISRESVVMDPEADRVQYPRTEFAAVVFHNIPETYPDDAHIECRYMITPDLVPTSRDWVGLYKVGWMTTRDYCYYEWAKLPADYEIGKEAEGNILFPSHKMPGDDGEFYQFCYVNSSGQIKGASTPFKFKKPSADDFVEIEDEESEMLFIRSKSVVLEETLRQLEEDKQQLLKAKQDLEHERDGLVNKLCELDKKLEASEDENIKLQEQVHSGEQYITQLNQEARDMNVLQEELQTKSDNVHKEKETMVEKIKSMETEIDKLKSMIKKLQNEKDERDGELRSLKEQMELYKSHFHSSEKSAQEYGQQIEEMQIKLAKQESLVAHYRRELEDVKNKLEEEQTKFEQQMLISQNDRENLERLNEKLKNTEDKLSAAENTKIIMQEEIKTYEELKEQMSKDLEKSKTENYHLKHQLAQLEETFTKETELLMNEVTLVHEELTKTKQDKDAIEEEKNDLRDRLERTTETTESSLSSMHCLKMAQDNLKDRYKKIEENCNELHTEIAKRTKEHKERETLLLRENEDLKERVHMGSAEYKNLYIENRKLAKKLEKITNKKKSHSVERQDTITSVPGSAVRVEQLQTSADNEDKSSMSGHMSVCSVESDTTVTRLQNVLENMSQCLDKRQDKKDKYKKLYVEEREKLETLRKHYMEELRNKEEEIERFRRLNEETVAEYEMKVRSLEKFVGEKEKIVDELNRKLRDNTRFHDGPSSTEESDKEGNRDERREKVTPVTAQPIKQPVMMYRNPYISASPNVAYPPHMPLTRLSYPSVRHTPFHYPEHIVTNVDIGPEQTSESRKCLVPPLQPLPPPLVPERVATYTVTTSDHGASELWVHIPPETINTENIEGAAAVPSAPPAGPCDLKEERYEDAIGEPMKNCPVCSETFSADIDDENFEAHVLTHIGRICPVCLNLVEEVDDHGFLMHVNEHLDKKNGHDDHSCC